MYDVRQFKPVLYVLVALGFLGFAIAAESPGIFVLGTMGLALNAWMVLTHRFRPLPGIAANVISVAALAYIVLDMQTAGSTPILIVGNFLVILQLVKLFVQRSNRDYAQVLVLSLLLMVAAAINTASLAFGIIFIVYMFLALYGCLLFHLKTETDHARAVLGASAVETESLLSDEQRHLSRSMGRLTWVVSLVSSCFALIVFIFWPRGAGAGLLSPLQFRPPQTLTGFDDKVKFQDIAKITQDNTVVAHVRLTHNGQVVRGSQTLLLRGVTLDRYSGADATVGPAFQWSRTPGPPSDEAVKRMVPDDPFVFTDSQVIHINSPDLWVQDVTLLPTGTSVLFSMAGPAYLVTNRSDTTLKFVRHDQSVQATDNLNSQVHYQVYSTDTVGSPVGQGGDTGGDSFLGTGSTMNPLDHEYGGAHSSIDRRIADFARRPDVSGPLLATRGNADGPNPLDPKIARNIEQYLLTHFTYTLDLTDAAKVPRGQDPLVSFLYDFKRGHCEYFAGAMAAMCQSLHMNARVVVGFKCTDYNPINGVYIVRQSHAHTWVEVQNTDGTWDTYDPTTGREDNAVHQVTLVERARHVFDYLEFNWANYVVAYDHDSRDNLVQNVENKVNDSASTVQSTINNLKNLLPENKFTIASAVIVAMLALSVLSMVSVIAFFLLERWKLRRLARHIGLGNLPDTDQLRLARQLEFYGSLLTVLDRHGIHRPRHLTPLEFAGSLAYLPNEAYTLITRLTELYYRIRYGQAALNPTYARRLDTIVQKIDTSLSPLATNN